LESAMSQPGIVAIGRNEGERLRLCLESDVARGYTVVYVDSGSIDGSVELARSKGMEVVDLDLTHPPSRRPPRVMRGLLV
jgi:glycosyltransferase involved in cell wall biosynthesis